MTGEVGEQRYRTWINEKREKQMPSMKASAPDATGWCKKELPLRAVQLGSVRAPL